jgi:cystathionine beta-lyase/cystathionine gamma-synthase
VLPNVKSGDHIVSVRHPYTWAKKMFNEILPRFNVSTTYIDGRNTENFRTATQPNTTLYYLESPNSWMFELQDLQAVASLAKGKEIVTICDNSYCTPLYQKPIESGIDLVLQSATKYIGGHSDTVAGVLTGNRKMIERIFNSEYMNTGSGIMPFNAWLLIRGLRTLPLRLERITNTTNRVVEYLKQHPVVEKVVFPFDKDFPQYELSRRQMKGACGLLSFVMKAKNIETIETFCESLRHILMAVSWGGYESLIIPWCASLKSERFSSSNEEHRMLRLYCGLEDAEYIIADLNQAFSVIESRI